MGNITAWFSVPVPRNTIKQKHEQIHINMSKYWHMQQCRSISRASVCSCLMPQTHFSCCLPKHDYRPHRASHFGSSMQRIDQPRKIQVIPSGSSESLQSLVHVVYVGKVSQVASLDSKGFWLKMLNTETLKRHFLPTYMKFVSTFNVSFELDFSSDIQMLPNEMKQSDQLIRALQKQSLTKCIHQSFNAAKTVTIKQCRVIKTMHQKVQEFQKGLSKLLQSADLFVLTYRFKLCWGFNPCIIQTAAGTHCSWF